MARDDKGAHTPEASTGSLSPHPRGDAQAAPESQSAHHPAQEGSIEAFCSARMAETVESLLDVIAEDYAQDMSEATGVHADYFRTRPVAPKQ